MEKPSEKKNDSVKSGGYSNLEYYVPNYPNYIGPFNISAKNSALFEPYDPKSVAILAASATSATSAARPKSYNPKLEDKCPEAKESCGYSKVRKKIEAEVHPSKKIFIMMDYPEDNKKRKLDKHMMKLANARKAIASKKGLKAVLAEDKDHCGEDLFCNICLYMQTSNYGIAIFSKTPEYNYNPNVAYELGFMHSKGKRCLILKDRKIKVKNPVDLIGRIAKKFTYSNISEAKKHVKKWIEIIS